MSDSTEKERKERFLNYVQHKALNDSHFDGFITFSANGAYEYAQTFLKSLVVLNGGAFTVLPAFFQVSTNKLPEFLPCTLLCYFCGLSVALVSMFCAHFGFVFSQKHTMARKHRQNQKIEEAIYQKILSETPSAEQTEIDIFKSDSRSKKFEFFAYFLGVCSFFAFIVGGCLLYLGGPL